MNIKRVLSTAAAFAIVGGASLTLAIYHGNGSAKADTGIFTISGQVAKLPSNNSVQNVDVTATEPNGDTVDFGPVQTDSNGLYSLTVGAGTYDFHFTPPSGSKLQSYVDSNVTVSSNQTINAKLPPTLNYITGTVTSSDGTPLSGVSVTLQSITGNTPPQARTCTDANGYYSLGAWPDQYYVDLTQDVSFPACTRNSTAGTTAPNGNLVISGFSQAFEGVDVTNGNAVKNFNFSTAKLTVTAKDSYGNPIVGRTIQTTGGNLYESSLISGGSNALLVGTSQLPPLSTDDQGMVSGYVANGTQMPAGTICINPYPSNYFCGNVSVTVNGDTNVTIQQQPVIMPAAPSYLQAESPTSQVNLSWGAVDHATSYKVYRNGQYLTSTTQMGYTDNTALPGTSTYHVTAVNGNGEGPASSTISVTLLAAPVVHVTSPAASQTVSGTVHINGTINASSDYNVQLYVFNSASQAVVGKYQYAVPSATTGYDYTWDTTAVPNGNYTVVLSAKDAQGRKDAGSTSTVHITVNN